MIIEVYNNGVLLLKIDSYKEYFIIKIEMTFMIDTDWMP